MNKCHLIALRFTKGKCSGAILNIYVQLVPPKPFMQDMYDDLMNSILDFVSKINRA